MEPSGVKIFNYSDIFFSSIHQGNTICTNRAFAHLIIYISSGEISIMDNGKEIMAHAGECIFIRRDHRVTFTKRPAGDEIFIGITMMLTRNFLRDYYQKLDRKFIPRQAQLFDESVIKLPKSPALESIFLSLAPYFHTDEKPSDDILNLKMQEGVMALLNINADFYPVLFDFTDPWKIDILEFLNANYMYELTMEEIASYTGRSLSTFKRDFKRISNLTPQKWLIKKRLEVAYELIRKGNRKVSDIYVDVGFKNRSHFTTSFKKKYGFSPSVAN